jgi:MFS transporter, PAT family, beta-lactamase induction signal transducer AmpG
MDWRTTMAPYVRPRPIAAGLLGISSGFPLALLLGTMAFWLAKVGIDKKTIGFAIGLTTPYTLKFLWAPMIDRLRVPVLANWVGQRRAWLFTIQALLFGSVWMLGASRPEVSLGTFAFWAIVTAFLGATQDIVIDAYRIEILSDEELPHGTANNQFGYRLGNFLAGVGTISLASPEGFGLGWAIAYGLTAFCVVPGFIAGL